MTTNNKPIPEWTGEEHQASLTQVQSNIGIIHVCHAPVADIEGFLYEPVRSQWQLIRMPTAPLIRLELLILDNPANPYRFESFLNIAAADQARALHEQAQ